MSYTRTLEHIENDLKETSKDAPCEASYLLLMRGVAKGWTPKSLAVEELIINDFSNRMDRVDPRKQPEEYCEELTRRPLNLIHTVNAISIGDGAAHLGTKEANQSTQQGVRFLNNYQKAMERCRGTLFYANKDAEEKEKIDGAINTAKLTRENLQEFQQMNARCMQENKRRR